MSRSVAWCALAVVMALVGALGALGFWMPTGRDQGIFATGGLMLAEGRVLYRDVFEVKQPLILFAYRWAFAIAGRATPEVVNAVDCLWRVASMPVFYALGARLHGRLGGLVAATAFGAMSVAVFGEFWDVAQAETFAGVLLALAFLLVLPRSSAGTSTSSPGRFAWIGAGVAATAALSFKATAALPALALVAAAFVARDGAGPRVVVKRIGYGALGAAIVVVPLVAYFLAHGALGHLFEVQIGFNRFHAWRYSLAAVWRIHFVVLFEPWHCVPAGLSQTAALMVAVWLAIRGPAAGRVLACWYAFAWLTIPIQGKLWQYHYALVLPPQVLLIAWWMTAIVRGRRRNPQPWAVALGGLGVAVIGYQVYGIARDHAARWSDDVARATGSLSDDAYRALPRFQIGDGQHYRTVDLDRAAAWLRSRATAGDQMMVLGLDQTLNFLSALLPPTRYLYSYPLVARLPGYASERARHRRAFLDAIVENTPRYLVVPAGPVDIGSGQTPLGKLADFHALGEWALRRYRRVADVGAYAIFERRETAGR